MNAFYETTHPIELLLESTRTLVSNPCGKSLTFDQLANFYYNAKDTSDIFHLLRQYTNDVTCILDLLTKFHSCLTDGSIQIRTTKIRKRIVKALKTDYDDDSATDSSQN